MVPKVEFETSKIVNEFCHLSVLYADLMPLGLATAILRNKPYLERYHHLRQDGIRLKLQAIGPFSSETEWYRFAAGLMKRDHSDGFDSMPDTSLLKMFRDLCDLNALGFEEIWSETRKRLEEYQHGFASQWMPISDRVLSELSNLAKTPWPAEKIHVHFVDCLYGGFGWDGCIGFTPFPDMEVQKKFIAHELSELITPQQMVAESLRKIRCDPGITHTVVDMLAYFSVRGHLAKPVFPYPEKKGIRPNPNYYPCAEALFPIFERYAKDPRIYPDFKSFVQDMILGLQR